MALVQATVASHGVASHIDLRRAGLTRKQIDAELAAGRYLRLGRGSYLVDCSAPDLARAQLQLRWQAVIDVCPRATLDGLSALQHAGLRTVVGDGLVHVSAPKSSRPVRVGGVVVHETRRWQPSDVLADGGLPRVRPEVAAVRAALWARSDREAALFLVSPAQQRLTTAAGMLEVAQTVRRHRRRRLVLAVLADVAGGVQALGELDFARLCRAHGLPEPDRQVVREGPGGRVYLDVRWAEYQLVVEIDGVQHLQLDLWLADSLRQNAISLGDVVVLRIPNLGLRLQPEQFMAQVGEALRSRGWRPSQP